MARDPNPTPIGLTSLIQEFRLPDQQSSDAAFDAVAFVHFDLRAHRLAKYDLFAKFIEAKRIGIAAADSRDHGVGIIDRDDVESPPRGRRREKSHLLGTAIGAADGDEQLASSPGGLGCGSARRSARDRDKQYNRETEFHAGIIRSARRMGQENTLGWLWYLRYSRGTPTVEEDMQIAKDTVVTMHYTLKNDQGKILDSSSGGDPLVYLHGAQNIIPGLEEALTGKKSGDKLNVTVAPDKGYGQRDERMVQTIPKSQFPNPDKITPGQRFQVNTDQGMLVLTVTEVRADEIVVDGNPELAGQTLHFDVEISEVRAATKEELAHGHAHGAGGHHH